ncbi:MAG: hypothetical protein A2X46_04490 [Lentisphaerae bacterium GWF2_57_35]|nr:MAG: hypothetical protein A2X46_04490 [Lentisphaerae bacterium GWF2_57_35]
MNNKSASPATPSRTAIFLSAFVYPGVGQCFQKRWLTGAVFAGLFTVLAVVLIYVVFKPLLHNLNAVLGWSANQMNEPLESMSLRNILTSFGLLILVYVLNLLDVVRAQRRSFTKAESPL